MSFDLVIFSVYKIFCDNGWTKFYSYFKFILKFLFSFFVSFLFTHVFIPRGCEKEYRNHKCFCWVCLKEANDLYAELFVNEDVEENQKIISESRQNLAFVLQLRWVVSFVQRKKDVGGMDFNELHNMMEDDVWMKLDTLLPMMPQYCDCQDCRLDMAAYTLNRVPAKYVHSTKGEILHRFDHSSTQAEASLTSVVVQAIQTIGENPIHKK